MWPRYNLTKICCLFYMWIFCLILTFLIRFQEQSELRGCNPGDFQMALEEALLADQGFTEKLMQDIHMAAGNQPFDDSVYGWIQEAAGSSQYLDHVAPSQASFSFLGVPFRACIAYSFICLQDMLKKYRNPRACVGCGMVLSFKMAKKMKALLPGDQLLCKPCSRVRKVSYILLLDSVSIQCAQN